MKEGDKFLLEKPPNPDVFLSTSSAQWFLEAEYPLMIEVKNISVRRHAALFIVSNRHGEKVKMAGVLARILDYADPITT